MTIFFPGPGVRITHEVVETLAPHFRSYRINELHLAHVLHETFVEVAMASPTMRVCSSAMTGLAATAAAAGSEVLHSPHATVMATTVAVAAAVSATIGWRLWRRPRALWAMHHGERVCLFVSRDRLVFGQVKRALLRAIESEKSGR